MKNMIPMKVDSQPNSPFKGIKVRAINHASKTIKLFPKVKEAADFFEMTSSKLCRFISEGRTIEKENNTYSLERYS